MSIQNNESAPRKTQTPIVFISHRHKDKNIADVLREFIVDATQGLINVYQSSDASGTGIPAGLPVTDYILEKLYVSEIVLLIYTVVDENWSWCSFECGAAYEPKAKNTKIVVLQCSDNIPAQFKGFSYVDAKNPLSVSQFVNDLLTEEEFFPRHKKKITGLSTNCKKIHEYGKKLYNDLKEVIPKEPNKKETTWPSMIFQMDIENEDVFANSTITVALANAKKKIVIKEVDERAQILLNMTDSKLKGMTLEELSEEWRKERGKADWIDCINVQIVEAGRGSKSVTPDWRQLEHASGGSWHVPILLFFQRLPRDNCLQFDVFLPASIPFDITRLKRNPRGLQKKPISPIKEEPFTEPLTGIRFLWIPGGSFRMGSEKIIAEAHARPSRITRISPFWIAEAPVTNRQYEIFVELTERREPQFIKEPKFSDPEQPVVGVSWEDANDFCKWLSKETNLKVVLPSEAQWEFSARGVDGRTYPWGEEEPDKTRACFDLPEPARIASYPRGKGPFGTLDQAGNVWEWCRDAWDEKFYEKRNDNELDPVYEESSNYEHIIRGGAWDNKEIKFLQSAYRGNNITTINHKAFGFRIAILFENILK